MFRYSASLFRRPPNSTLTPERGRKEGCRGESGPGYRSHGPLCPASAGLLLWCLPVVCRGAVGFGGLSETVHPSSPPAWGLGRAVLHPGWTWQALTQTVLQTSEDLPRSRGWQVPITFKMYPFQSCQGFPPVQQNKAPSPSLLLEKFLRGQKQQVIETFRSQLWVCVLKNSF